MLVMADRLCVHAANCSGRQHHDQGYLVELRHRQGVHHDTSSRQDRISHRRQAAIPPGYLVALLYEMSLQGPSFVTIPKSDYRD
jgi:hypothetical protein